MTAPTAARSSRVPTLAFVWSLICAALGLWWLLDPAAYLLDDPFGRRTSLMMVIPTDVGGPLFLVLGLAAAAVCLLLQRRHRVSSPHRVDSFRAGAGGRSAGGTALVVAGATLALFFGVAVPDVQVLAVLGYAVVLLGGPILVGLLILGTRRHPGNLLVLLVVAIAISVGIAAGQIGEPTLHLLASVRDGFGRVGRRPLVLGFMLVGGLLLGATTVLAVRLRATHRIADRETGADLPGGQRLQRWGCRATIVAALCPLPYGLLRMTWLTPWPQGLGPGTEVALDGGVRIFGVGLGLAALGAAWLTLGLISPWGETWPAWLPGLRGRPVPVLAAVVPAAVVAMALCASSVSLMVLSAADGGPWLAAVLPAPLWGPALALATYAYHRRRTDGASSSEEGERAMPPLQSG